MADADEVVSPAGRRATPLSLGIDIGGTFTDIVVVDHATGERFSRKQLTAPDDPAAGVIAAIDNLLDETGIAPAAIGRVVHATTLFSNALIERKGAKTGLITTEGFRDILEIGRERKYDLYDVNFAKPAPLVPRRWRLEVAERVKADGRVVLALDGQALRRAVAALRDQGVESLAVVFLHAYLNPVHEQAAGLIIGQEFPDLAVSLSSAVAPEIREFERASTTVTNAYIKPLAGRYLDHMATEIAARGVSAPLLPMLSSGGLTNLDEAKRTPVQLLESGPAAGALAAAFLGKADGGRRILAFDMGGTTAKLSLVDDGKPLVAYDFEAARQKRFLAGSGLPIRISTVELIEIGAGGGSVAWCDEIGLLKVGPESAGSMPGPASYGLGGRAPTVTDADFLLGYLDPGYFAGGDMAIDMAACRQAIGRLAAETGLTAERLAAGIHDVVDENMASAARIHIAERGRSPADYAMLATGGAGPVHAWGVARKLGLRRIVCPTAAGVASALGLLVAPARVDRVATVNLALDAMDWQRLEAVYQSLEADGRAVIGRTGLDPASATVCRLADIRYIGQAYELVVDLPDGCYSAASKPALLAAFERQYREHFTRTPPAVPIEFVNLRVRVQATVPGAAATTRTATTAPAEKLKGTRMVFFPESGPNGGEFVATPVYAREGLLSGDRFDGPAVVEERDSTLVVGPGGRAVVTAAGNIVVELDGSQP